MTGRQFPQDALKAVHRSLQDAETPPQTDGAQTPDATNKRAGDTGPAFAKRAAPVALLVGGVSLLVGWGATTAAPRIEDQIAAQVKTAFAQSRHEIDAAVSGRDVTLTGMAHDPQEQTRIVTTFAELPGVRRVDDQLSVLDVAAPYTLQAEKSADGFAIQGFTPDTAAERLMRSAAPKGAALAIVMAAGEPDQNWGAAAQTALEAFDHVTWGDLHLTDHKIVFAAQPRNKAAADLLRDYAAQFPAEYEWSFEVRAAPGQSLPPEFGADGTVSDLTIRYDANSGFSAEALPDAVNLSQIEAAFGLGSSEEAPPQALAPLVDLRPWMPPLETADIILAGRDLNIEATAQSDINADTLAAEMRDALGPDVTITITASERRFDEGHERTNPITGLVQENSGGYWYPVVKFTPSASQCDAEVAKLRDQLAFVPDRAEFASSAPPVLGALTMTIVRCLFDDALRIEVTRGRITGRQKALADALIQRGVPADRVLTPTTQRGPVRTELRWTGLPDTKG